MRASLHGNEVAASYERSECFISPEAMLHFLFPRRDLDAKRLKCLQNCGIIKQRKAVKL